MKKVAAIILVSLVMLTSFQRTTVADNSLDMEQVAVQTIKNSQEVKKADKQVSAAHKNYNNTVASMEYLKSLWQRVGSFATYQNTVLGPLSRRASLDAATNTQRVTNNAVRLNAYKNYVALLKAQHELDIWTQQKNAADADLSVTQSKEKLGLVAVTQTRFAEIIYKQAQLRADSAQRKYDSAAMSVNRLMGEDLSRRYERLQADNIFPAAKIRTMQECIDSALVARSEIVSAQNTLELVKEQFALGKTQIHTDHNFYLQQQEYSIDGAQYAVDMNKLGVQLDIISLYQNAESALKNVEAMKDLAAQAKQNAEAAEIQYTNGMFSLLELNNARIAKAQADINLKNAELDTWLAQVTLDMACDIGYKS